MARLDVAVAGDCMPSRGALVSSAPGAAELRGLLERADFAVANLETLVSGRNGNPAYENMGSHLTGDPSLVDAIRDLGIDAVGCANNHALDMGVTGLLAAMDALTTRGLPFAGVGHDLPAARMPVYLDRPAGSLAVISCSATFTPGNQAADPSSLMGGRPGLNPLRHHTVVHVTGEQLAALRDIEETTGMAAPRRTMDEQLGRAAHPDQLSFLGGRFRRAPSPGMTTDCDLTDVLEISGWVADARRRADAVLVSVHSHEQGATPAEPAAFLRSFARLMIDAGADIVAGHGPHHLRGMEIYQGRPIFYSLGNFVSQIELAERIPAEDFARAGRSPWATTPSEFFRARDDQVLFGADRRYWQTVLPLVALDDDGPADIMLYPVSLGFGLPVHRRGRPALADGPEAAGILAGFARQSESFGTKITVTATGSPPTGQVEISQHGR